MQINTDHYFELIASRCSFFLCLVEKHHNEFRRHNEMKKCMGYMQGLKNGRAYGTCEKKLFFRYSKKTFKILQKNL